MIRKRMMATFVLAVLSVALVAVDWRAAVLVAIVSAVMAVANLRSAEDPMAVFDITPAGVGTLGDELVDVAVNGDRSLYETPRAPAERWIAERCQDGDTVVAPERRETGREFHQRRSRTL